MESSKEAKLSRDERLSPIKFSSLGNSTASGSEIRPNEDSLNSPDLVLHDLKNYRASNSKNFTSARRKTISSTTPLKTPSRVQKVTSFTSPRRNREVLIMEDSAESPLPVSSGRPVWIQKGSTKRYPSAGLLKSVATDIRNEFPEEEWTSKKVDELMMTANDKEILTTPSSEETKRGSQISIEVYDPSSQMPVFSSSQFKELQADFSSKTKELESVISAKNAELTKLAAKMIDFEGQLMTEKEDSIKNENIIRELEIEIKALQFQMHQISVNFNHAKGLLKAKTSSLEKNEEECLTMKKSFKEQLEQKTQACIKSNKKLKETELALESSKLNVYTMEKEVAKMEAEINNLKEVMENSERDFKRITIENESMKASQVTFQEKELQSKAKIDFLESEVGEKEESLNGLRAKFCNLTEEAELLHEEMLSLESEQKRMETEIMEKSQAILQLKSDEKKLKTLLSDQGQKLENLYSVEQELRAQIQNDEKLISESRQRIIDLESQNNEKDKIISGDTRKLTELVQEVTEQKNLISDQKEQLVSLDKNAKLSTSESDEEILKLKKEISLAQEKTDRRIQEVAEQLYHQYSKKHEAKVTQLKLKYEGRLEERVEELERNERLVESLQSQLRTEMKEKKYLLGVLERGDRLSNESHDDQGTK